MIALRSDLTSKTYRDLRRYGSLSAPRWRGKPHHASQTIKRMARKSNSWWERSREIHLYRRIVLSYSRSSMQYVVMTVGKTHSGKSTFGKEIAKKLSASCLLDFDVLVEFLKTTYPWLYEASLFKTKKEAEHAHYISLDLRKIIFKESLKTNLPILFTSANVLKKLRNEFCSFARKAKKKIIMVYFNWPEEILIKRVETTIRSKACLSRSSDFKDLLVNRQSKIFEAPDKKEADIFLEITDDKSWEEAQKKILSLVNKTK